MPRSLTTVIVLLVALVLGALPVAVMRAGLHYHVRAEAERQLATLAQRAIAHVDAVLTEAADALSALAPQARESCQGGRELISRLLGEATYLRGLAVFDREGKLACGAGEVAAERLAEASFRSARQRQLSLGVWAGEGGRARLVLRLTEGGATLHALIAADAHRLDVIPEHWRDMAIGVLALDDGGILGLVPRGMDARESEAPGGELLSARAQSERFPVHMSLSLPYAAAWEGERPLTLIVDIGGGLIGLLFVVLVFHSTRRPISLEQGIARGLARDEFVPFYQPVFDIQSGRLVGCEVLIRWRRRDGTMIPPGAFIHQAEESGLAVEMTRRLMRRARDELGAHYAARPELKLAFNLCAAHFSDLSTIQDVRDVFARGGIRYAQLVFEVTERYPLPNLDRAKVAISGLQALGCRVSLDDAGTGHGGLTYLQKLGMDQLKIDKFFVDTITSPRMASPIVDSLCDLGRSLGMEIVAEGVETADQLAYLQAHGVHCAQGFLFAQPLPGPAYIKLIEALRPIAPPPEASANSETREKPRRAPRRRAA